MHKKGNNNHNQGGNMSNFISRFFVVCLLLSIVTEVSAQQAPDRNIDKSKQDKTVNQRVPLTKDLADFKMMILQQALQAVVLKINLVDQEQKLPQVVETALGLVT